MAVSFTENVPEEDDEYIDMEITSFSNIFSNSRPSREFEFQMSSLSMERESTTSPADELFYKGNLLPLHLLEISEPGFGSVYGDENGVCRESYGTPLATTITTPTPFESCNVSPCDSCTVSRELSPVEYSFYECWAETDVSRCIDGDENRKKSWTKMLKLSSRLKASRAYLKALFRKSGCSYESSAVAKDGDRVTVPKPNRSLFGQMNREKSKKLVDNGAGNGQSNRHRRLFSMVIEQHSSTNESSTSSSSSSLNSNGFRYLPFLNGSSSVKVKIESPNPIQGAIAHCKQSQMSSRKPAGDVGFYSLSDSNMAVFQDQERPDPWRG
ncbi:probable membrane-associated kinase regulator 4 [Hibiscus syriacus]|uniref:probable membrane-associated kinase regulator 4 n=1 Tax=Hibiscus syriacus TaxID=106335 RepID=UPI001921171B|nr:probable membrane-associated kinase regulator 4 [Hibiscus syriacus]